MADFVDRIKLIVDMTTDKATAGMGAVKESVNQAEGTFGKLKAGASSAFQEIGLSAGLGAAAAGAAVGKFVFDSVNGFEALALKANDFAVATGLGVDDASRWMEVAGDVGVNVDTLEGAINKMNIAAGKGDLAKLGVDAGTTNEMLLASLSHIQAIPDASQRAVEGVKIFGKSWTQLAPLVESAGNLKQALQDVSEGQAISPAEVEKAKAYRDAMDALSDAWTAFKMNVGEWAIGPITDILGFIDDVKTGVEGVAAAVPGGGGIDWGEVFGANTLPDITGGLKQLSDGSLSVGDRAKGLAKGIGGLIPGLGGWADETFTVKGAQDEATDATAAATAAAKAQADQAKATQDAIEQLTNAVLASFNSQLAYEDAQGKTTTAIGKYVTAAVQAGDAAGQSTTLNDAYKASMNDAEQAALAQAASALKLATDTATAKGETIDAAGQNAILRSSLLDVANTLGPNDPLRQQLMNYIAQLGQIPADKHTDVTANTNQAEQALAHLAASVGNVFAKSAFSPAGLKASPGMVVPAPAAPSSALAPMAMASARSAPVINVTYNAGPGVNPADVIRAINRWTGTRGTPISTGATGL